MNGWVNGMVVTLGGLGAHYFIMEGREWRGGVVFSLLFSLLFLRFATTSKRALYFYVWEGVMRRSIKGKTHTHNNNIHSLMT